VTLDPAARRYAFKYSLRAWQKRKVTGACGCVTLSCAALAFRYSADRQ
jgi:hypothetical protein